MALMLTCDTHAHSAWQGDIVCAPRFGGCGRVYQTKDSSAPFYAPARGGKAAKGAQCACGKILFYGKKKEAEETTGRAICHACFDDRKFGRN